jgi:dipeptidyl aminopeptidase/acylaminoacyl peptidase
MATAILDSDQAEKRFVVGCESDRDPGGYYLMDLAKDSMRLLHKAAPWIKPDKTRPMQAISYLSRDGIPIEAYLTLPAEPAKGGLPPLVVIAHEGPSGRIVWGFSREAQLLASRGYAVLQPNYRGSLGYDWRFSAEDRWNFMKMSDDVTDGVKHVIQSGLVDRTKVAIMGLGFGGYLSIRGATDEPGLYRCAVAINGIFDWKQLVLDARRNLPEGNPGYDILCRYLGDPVSEARKLDAMSPLGQVARLKCPVLVYHSWAAPNTPIDQSGRLISALKASHVTFDDVMQDRYEMVWVQELEFNAILAFLAKNMGGAPTAQVGN